MSKNQVGPPLPTPQQLSFVFALPVHHPQELLHYLRRVDGFEDVAQKTAGALAGAKGALTIPNITPKGITDGLEFIARVKQIEDALYPYYRRAYENRLEADGQVMSALFKIWRIVDAANDRALRDRFQFLGDWISRHHAHNSVSRLPSPAPSAPAANG